MSRHRPQTDVNELLTERARYEMWLEQLAAKAAQMPQHVVERVRGDYTSRLDRVVDELLSRAEEMRKDVESLEKRVSTLVADVEAWRDARAEDELRALVGEYDETTWERKAAEHDAGIEKLEAERAERVAEHERACTLLAEATRPPATHEPQQIEPEEDPLAEIPTTRNPSPFDEIGFLRTVVGRATPFPAAGVPFTPPEEDVSGERPVDEALPAELPVAEVPPPPPPRPSQPVSQESVEASLGNLSRPSSESPRIPADVLVDETMTVTAGDVRSDRPSMSASDPSRSLKCQECGWMNYPTEWYCEKCGGELAAF